MVLSCICVGVALAGLLQTRGWLWSESFSQFEGGLITTAKVCSSLELKPMAFHMINLLYLEQGNTMYVFMCESVAHKGMCECVYTHASVIVHTYTSTGDSLGLG